jgi:acetyl-CoA C-acetyltransferase
MIKDGLWDVYNDYHMGNAAELCAKECNIPRDAQDAFAVESYRRAQSAWTEKRFVDEVVAVEIPSKKEPVVVAQDEEPFKTNFDKIPTLRPAFQKDGTVTAANASKINDGAAAMVVTSADFAKRSGLKPLARVVAYASSAKPPEWFTTAPSDVIEKLFKRTGMKKEDIDLFEINEAFAVVTLAVNSALGLDPATVNVNGGAVALGHPIGASGARILVTLVHALHQRKKRFGLAAICIGGGEAAGMIVERLD